MEVDVYIISVYANSATGRGDAASLALIKFPRAFL